MRIRKSRCIKSNKTYCCIGKFNAALSLYEVLGVALYFSKDFSEAAVGRSVVTEVLWLLEVTVACFLEQYSNL